LNLLENLSHRRFSRIVASASAMALGLLLSSSVMAQEISRSAQDEMRLLMNEKRVQSDAGRKLDTRLRLAWQRLNGQGAGAQLTRLRVQAPDALGRFQLDILLRDETALPVLQLWLRARADTQLVSAAGREVRIWLRWQDIDALAAMDEVHRLRMAVPAITSRMSSPDAPASPAPSLVNVSQGVAAHRVDTARANLGITGLGQKICALSDSIDHLGLVQSSGDLPQGIEVLPGQSGLGRGSTGEGTAMLEIIHDIAPDARLGFATAFTGVAAFAQNVRDLRFVAGCDVLVDDIFYFNEPPFQDGPIAQAVNDVTADGALYFASAGNAGNVSNGTSGVYEGDFVDAGVLPALPGGSVNLFEVDEIGSSNQILVLQSGFAASLHWTDPLGASGNDYDVFVMSPDLQHVLDAGTDLQDGDDDPFEITGQIFPNDRIVVWKAAGAATRFLHLNGLRGRFNLGTGGQTKGHSAAAAAFSVAAVDVFWANGGAFVGSAANPVESFSSDGPRRMFYSSNGSLLNSLNPSLLSDGGVVFAKPDIAAADGVSTATPGFSQFFGTSAAAPHAAAISALLQQAAPSATPAQIRTALLVSALDIETPGPDALSGVGIVMADTALAAIGAVPAARLQREAFSLSNIDGDGDAVAEPGETLDLAISMKNLGAATATDISLALTSSTPGVELLRAEADFPELVPNASAFGLQTFRLRLAPDYACGTAIELQLLASFSGASPGVTTQNLSRIDIAVGTLGSAMVTHFSGPAQAIPDGDPSGLTLALPMIGSGLRVGDLDVTFEGAECSSDFFATGVGLQHTFIGDLEVIVATPDGTSTRLLDRPRQGVGDNSGNHLCQTVFDDDANQALADVTPLLAPFSDRFRPDQPLSTLNGRAIDGSWQLRFIDAASGDSGQVRAFQMSLRPALCNVHMPLLLHSDGFE
jgi:subtilisin-like proprotein convertase family protein